jgi:hypothetical protein
MEQTTKKNVWYGKIETKEDAKKVIKHSSNAFLVLAVVQIVLGFIADAASIIDGIVYLILALLLKKFNSRVVAIILLSLSLVSAVITGISKFAGSTGGQNILWALAIALISIRAVKATFAYNKLK